MQQWGARTGVAPHKHNNAIQEERRILLGAFMSNSRQGYIEHTCSPTVGQGEGFDQGGGGAGDGHRPLTGQYGQGQKGQPHGAG